MSVKLIQNSYGKSDVRITKVTRGSGRLQDKHDIAEFSVDIELSGAFDQSYTAGDNSKIVATDSMKNTVYVVAKENNFASAEEFASILAKHFVDRYSQVESANVTVREQRWDRIAIDAKAHNHAFISGGTDWTEARAVIDRDGSPKLFGGLRELSLVKTTHSSFEKFVSDRYRTLADSADRIFGTSVTATWQYLSGEANFRSISERTRQILIEVFATHFSRAVQETMYAMANAVLEREPAIGRIDLRLPNKHRIPFNLKPFGLENNNEIFVWTDEPYGDIRCSVTRS